MSPTRLERIVARLAEGGAAGAYGYPDPANTLEDSAFPLEKRQEERALWSGLLERAVPGARPVEAIALDAGCGLGTHTAGLAASFRWLLSIDADQRRLGEASRRVEQTVERAFFALPLEAPVLRDPALEGSFALVHCMQVLGHVPRSAAANILSTFSRLLAPGGALILAVPATVAAHDEHWVAQAATTGSSVTTPEIYDRLARSPVAGVLPVRHFAMPTLRALVLAAGFTIEEERPYNWFSYQRFDVCVLARKPIDRVA